VIVLPEVTQPRPAGDGDCWPGSAVDRRDPSGAATTASAEEVRPVGRAVGRHRVGIGTSVEPCAKVTCGVSLSSAGKRTLRIDLSSRWAGCPGTVEGHCRRRAARRDIRRAGKKGDACAGNGVDGQ